MYATGARFGFSADLDAVGAVGTTQPYVDLFKLTSRGIPGQNNCFYDCINTL